ncbi:MAG TPA: GNAT family acetyltransferase [Baekduia sp.]|nr:GNAT family acetyltransferase [Baekduia sp.]
MQIAPLTDDAMDAVIDLWRAAGLTRPWNDPEADLRRALAGPASTVLAGIEDGALGATAMVGHDSHRGWISYLAVREDARRRGHGAAMVAACEAWLRDRGVPKLNLMVRVDNAAAHAFYDGLGYGRDDVVVRARRLDG